MNMDDPQQPAVAPPAAVPPIAVVVVAPPAPAVPPAPPDPPRKPPSNLEVWLITIALVIAAARVGTIQASGYTWILMMVIMFTFVSFMGKWICGRPLGILITELNVMSIARFQMILWTMLILSAFLTIALQRIHAGIPDALNIPMNKELWALMGISTASLVGSPLLLQNKKTQEPTGAAVDKTAQLLKEDPDDIDNNRQGKLYSNKYPKDARFTDLFQGDDVGNTAYLDPAKLQMFFFTLIVAASYGYLIFHVMYGPTTALAMPTVSDNMIALLGISHAGYLGSKTVG